MDPKKGAGRSPAEGARTGAQDDERDSLEGGWFVEPREEKRSATRVKSVPPTGDRDVDAWLK